MVRQLMPAPMHRRAGMARRPPMCRQPAGFSLFELIVAVGVILLLSGLSINLMREAPLLQERRLRQAAVELQSHLLQARTLAQKVNSVCQVSLSTSPQPSVGADTSVSPNACTTTNLPSLNLKTASNVQGLAVVSGSTTTFSFAGIGTLIGAADAVTILSASNISAQWCVKVTAPAGVVLVGSRLSATDTCNYVRD